MRFLPQLLWNGWGLRGGVEMGTYWRPTVPNPHANPNVYDVQFLRSEALRSSSSSSSSSRTLQIKLRETQNLRAGCSKAAQLLDVAKRPIPQG